METPTSTRRHRLLTGAPISTTGTADIRHCYTLRMQIRQTRTHTPLPAGTNQTNRPRPPTEGEPKNTATIPPTMRREPSTTNQGRQTKCRAETTAEKVSPNGR
nr:hypothetical protein Iba_chr07dCG9830 [Ipomoea batatas]